MQHFSCRAGFATLLLLNDTNALNTQPIGMPDAECQPMVPVQSIETIKSKSASCNTSMAEEWFCTYHPTIAPDSMLNLHFNNVGIPSGHTTTARHRAKNGTDTTGFEQQSLWDDDVVHDHVVDFATLLVYSRFYNTIRSLSRCSYLE